ncbi:MAG: patatin-like phospholipase family protein [Candidatus Marinimicrobia bacterium]|nr:patatin-like phospholipase family protein [Candidatus Neomarinimicrobiota bacterium]
MGTLISNNKMLKSIFRKLGIGKRPKIGLALGGGGARGLSHIGVIEVLEKNNIPIDYISGCSIGSMVGAIYSHNPNIDYLKNKFSNMIESPEFQNLGLDNLSSNNSSDSTFIQQFTKIISEKIILKLQKERMGVLSADKFRKAIDVFLDGITFENSKIPFGVLTGNLNTGKGDFYTKGDIVQAVQASSSIPGWVEPVLIDNDLHTDGMISTLIPIKEIREMGADIVIAVDVTNRDLSKRNLISSIDIIEKANQIIKNNATDLILEKADIIIRPNTKGWEWYEYSHIDDMIIEGKKSANLKINELKNIII